MNGSSCGLIKEVTIEADDRKMVGEIRFHLRSVCRLQMASGDYP